MYNKLLYVMNFMIQQVLAKILKGESIDEPIFKNKFLKLFHKILSLEKQKTNSPKFSKCYINLAE